MAILAVAVAALLIARHQKSRQVDIAFDGTRFLIMTSDLQTPAYLSDFMLRSPPADAGLEGIPPSALPVAYEGSGLRVIRHLRNYSFELARQGQIASGGEPEARQRITFIAAGRQRG